jgi:hypothetical protein
VSPLREDSQRRAHALNLAAAVNIVLYDRHVKLGPGALAPAGAVLEEAALEEIELGSSR